MYRITLHIRWESGLRAPWTLLCLVCLVLAATAAQPAGQAAASDPQSTDAFVPAGGGQHYYLTSFNYPGNAALTACAEGYHMASLWEIYDVSSLTYDYSHPAAYSKSDSGRGAPSHWYGWIRTGFDSSTANTAGTGNCAAWTSTNGAHYGTILRLNYNWDVSVSAFPPWEPDPFTCAGISPVWCVGTFYSSYLPMIKR